jgi:hypothetical protein
MKFLIKIFCLLGFLSSFGFSKDVWVITDDLFGPIFPVENCEFFLGKSFFKCTNPETGSYRVSSTYVVKDYLYFNPTKSSGYFFDTNYYYFVDKVRYSGYFSYVNKYSSYLYSESDAKNGQLFTYTNITEFRVNDPLAECSANQAFNSETKQCVSCPKDHIFNNNTGKCEPELKRPDWCPKPMIYNERKVELLLRDKIVEECLPDPKIDKPTCEKMGWQFHDGCYDNLSGAEMATCMQFPEGCYAPETVNRFKAEIQLENDLFIMGGFMIPLPINAFKNGLSSFGSFLKGLFSSGAKPANLNLLEYRPQIVDVKATISGPEPVFNLNPVDDNAIVFNSVFKETGKLDTTASASSNIVKSPQATADVSPNLRKFDLPKDASISKLENNTIVTAKLKDMSKPIPTKEITVPNEVKNINLDYDLNTMFKASDKPTPNLPMTIKQTSNAGNKATYKGNIVTPDKSVIDVEVVETTTPTGSKVQDVTYSYIYKTPSGSSKFSTGYVNTITSDNKVTNSIPKDSTSTNSSGSSSNSGSGGSSSTTTPSQPSQSIDLSSLEQAINRNSAKLDTINDTLTSIKNQQQEQWNYEPNVNTATSFSALQSELTKFDVSVNDAFNFLNNFKGDIDNLMNNFNESLDIINKGIDAPDIPKGTCPFSISGPTPGSNTKNLFEIDPCRFVAPYKSILTLFFTIWFSFEIIMFSLKYLFRVGGES